MRQLLKGNYAVAEGARLCRVNVVSAYPITPQTTIVERLSEMCASGDLDAKFIKVESEHSAMATLVGASSAGVRVFTATSSNGLLLMHEVLHWVAGARLPVVMANVNRAVSGGWNIWADQTDAISQRDTGWVQIYCESSQEVLDSVIMAYRLAEKISMPVMLTYDAFFLSHTTETVDVPDIERVDAFLPPYRPEFKIDIDNPRMFGGLIPPEYFYEHRYAVHRASLETLDWYPEICRGFRDMFGREYGITEEYRTDDAEVVVVTAGTITSVVRITIDRMREAGIKVGLVKLRLFRPVPVERWRTVLGAIGKVVVIDRNLSPGLAGVFASEIQATLYPLENRPAIYPVVAGLGGRDVTPEDIEGIINHALSSDDPAGIPLFWGLKQ
ncbi:MAG TPA: pyruvate ferredoxin oxidoreductase [Syntrophales bacterium]|nr:pyruvate ferredoxin oxidoreductase [Syntrophales bacterium]HPQ43761.1 pyruvate ferredoxin oxidoreductase [Syntrophales bacterium]